MPRAIAPATLSTAPPDLPIDLPGHEPRFQWLTRGSETPTDIEIGDTLVRFVPGGPQGRPELHAELFV